MEYILLVAFIFLPVTFTGKVVAVIDGDTIEVLQDGKAVRIRLHGIDSPEKTQAFGSKAKEFTSNLVFSKNVKVVEVQFDQYGRMVADVYLIDGTWLNKAIVENGFAWHSKKYSNSQELAQAESNARKMKKGLWQDPSPIAPWEYRKSQKN
jgi:micrococcal nuclease